VGVSSSGSRERSLSFWSCAGERDGRFEVAMKIACVSFACDTDQERDCYIDSHLTCPMRRFLGV